MALKEIRCPICGNVENLFKEEIGGDVYWTCRSCDVTFVDRLAIREYERMESTIKKGMRSVIDEALLRQQEEKCYNLRSALISEIKAEYIDSEEIVKICDKIIEIFPKDFLADFFKVANGSDDDKIVEYINKIDVEKNEAYICFVIEFLIKSLKEKYIIPTAALLDRCGKVLLPTQKQKYYDRFEKEAGKVKEGLYVTKKKRDVFLAYSSKDMPYVTAILECIESNGLTCFAAFRNLQHGKGAVGNYESEIKEAIDHCSIFLFVSSANSRSFDCDAFDKELAYIRDTEMDRYSQYRSYEQIPERYKKLRIEYRLDNKKTPITDDDIKEFFSGLTYAENETQLLSRLAECKRQLRKSYFAEDNDELKNKHKAQIEEVERRHAQEIKDKELELARIKAEYQAKLDAAETQKRQTEAMQSKALEEALLKAKADEKRRAEEEANRMAEEEANRRAEETKRIAEEVKIRLEETRLRVEEELNRRAEEEAKKRLAEEQMPKTDEEAKRKVSRNAEKTSDEKQNVHNKSIIAANQGFVIEGKMLKKYTGREAKVVIPDIVTLIGSGAFSGCKTVQEVTVPNTVKTICNHAFNGCSNLNKLTLSVGLSGIGERAFAGCIRLKEVSLPDYLKTIGKEAFYGCTDLVFIDLPTSVATIETGAFARCPNLTIHVPTKDFATKFQKDWNCTRPYIDISADNYANEHTKYLMAKMYLDMSKNIKGL